MQMFERITTFMKDQDGAVTVDWVVLTAAIVGLAISAYTILGGQTMDLVETASTSIDARQDATPSAAGD
ncbi:hypothetical protein RISW2_00865 [Roseivivax isoporae LMG 25204]|uniref:Pilus assembly protein n=2 Tax=Roseivivax TaxID=93682 RepID=X7FDX5_9RHOB|nr:hypothetical protein RISW2_00865 [Roseivivax isoporae LMG 25204]